MPDELPRTWDPTTPLGRCEMELLDGRVFDLTGKTVEQFNALIRDLGITPADVLETRHYVAPGKIDARATFDLGRQRQWKK